MLYDTKPPLDEALLVHYGTKGMKWGIRRGKKVAGVSRAVGARIDRNKRVIRNLENARAGVGAHGVVGALGRKTLGEERWKKNMQTAVKELKAQNRRLQRGKETVTDLLSVYSTLHLEDLVVSRTPRV
jgi:hypothetical protein